MAKRRFQPLLHDRAVALAAPVQWWSRSDGVVADGVDGLYLGDIRLLDRLDFEVVDESPDGVGAVRAEHIASETLGAGRLRFVALLRPLDGHLADPDVRAEREVLLRRDGAEVRFTVRSRLDEPVPLRIAARLRPDSAAMDAIKTGFDAGDRPVVELADGTRASWTASGAAIGLSTGTPGAALRRDGDGLEAAVAVVVPARGEVSLSLDVRVERHALPVIAPAGPASWSAPDTSGADDRLVRWIDRALDDLDALRLEVRERPGDTFLAAGAPWFFTLFGRDSIWAARLLLPLGWELAAGTLRVLASLQGTERVVATAEQPGKIMHELRQQSIEIPDENVVLPPLYYGTIDATPLWICLLADAAEAGMPEEQLRGLLPNLEAALAWMRDWGDSDGDGLIEYVDESGQGLSNQGWKDSGDSVQWTDGRLAQGPLALAEVQAYAYEAAVRGAALLDRLGESGGDEQPGDEWRAWAARLQAAFRERFWVEHPDGAFPAISLDADKRAVDSLTSNIGHLLATGLLDESERARVAALLVRPELASGYGLRTLSTRDAGYWPLSYHGGTVWAHDTAIVIRALARDGFAAEAAQLAEGLLEAAPAFDYRMPELHGGDARADSPTPVPYPASCRPQAWSAAAAIAVLGALASSS